MLEKEETKDLHGFLKPLMTAIHRVCLEFHPSSFMVDCAKNERNAIHEVWPQALVYLCTFHVRKCWVQKLLELVSTHERRWEMNNNLGELMHSTSLSPDWDTLAGDWLERDTWRKLHLFRIKYALEENFLEYFKEQWEPCLGKSFFLPE